MLIRQQTAISTQWLWPGPHLDLAPVGRQPGSRGSFCSFCSAKLPGALVVLAATDVVGTHVVKPGGWGGGGGAPGWTHMDEACCMGRLDASPEAFPHSKFSHFLSSNDFLSAIPSPFFHPLSPFHRHSSIHFLLSCWPFQRSTEKSAPENLTGCVASLRVSQAHHTTCQGKRSRAEQPPHNNKP